MDRPGLSFTNVIYSHVLPTQLVQAANAMEEAVIGVDRMWQNPNRIHAVQGPAVVVAAVRRRDA